MRKKLDTSPLVFDQLIVGPVESALIIHDTKENKWHVIPVPTDKVRFTPPEIALLTAENLPEATGLYS